MATDLVQLKGLITIALTGKLGTYQTTLGPTPAIWVVPPALPNQRSVTGLECIIYRTPEMAVEGMLGAKKMLTRTYSIRLVQHNQDDSTEDATEALISYFPTVTSAVLLQATDVAPEQSVIRLSDFANLVKTSRIN